MQAENALTQQQQQQQQQPPPSKDEQTLSLLTQSLAQLNQQFGALATTLAAVVTQLAVVSQQQQQQLARTQTRVAPKKRRSSKHAVSTAAAPAPSAEQPLSPCSSSSGGSTPRNHDATAREEHVELDFLPSASTAAADHDALADPQHPPHPQPQPSSPQDDCVDGPYENHDLSSSGDDEEAEQHANRQMKMQDDELEAELSVSEQRGYGGKEHSLSRENRVRYALKAQSQSTPVHRNQAQTQALAASRSAAASAAVTASLRAESQSLPQQSQPQPQQQQAENSSSSVLQHWQSMKDGTAPCSNAATIATAALASASSSASQPNSPVLQSAPANAATAPAGISSSLLPSAALSAASSPRSIGALSHTSPTLLPFFRRLSTGSVGSPPQPTHSMIAPSATAVPLDAPDSMGMTTSFAIQPRQHSASATSSPSHSVSSRLPHHHASARAASMQVTSGASSPPQRAQSGSATRGAPMAGAAAAASLHRAHSVSADGLPSALDSTSSAASSSSLPPLASSIYLDTPNKIKLNVGGQIFCTTLSTLLREPTGSMFSGMLSGHFGVEGTTTGAMAGSAGARSSGSGSSSSSALHSQAIFIDRDPTMFRHILNYLRDGNISLHGMTTLQKQALGKEARYYGLAGLVSVLQLDARALRTAQRRELSSEKEFKLVPDVSLRDMATVIKTFTNEEGYEFEDWMSASTITTKSSSTKSSTTTSTSVHLLFSKKLSRGELMLLDRLQYSC